MKALPKLSLLILFLFMLTPDVWSQETDSTSLARLRIEIRKLEAAATNAPFELREVNDRFLQSRRAHLKILLRQRLTALEKYSASVQSMLNAEERKDLASALEEIRLELDDSTSEAAAISSSEPNRSKEDQRETSPVATNGFAEASDRVERPARPEDDGADKQNKKAEADAKRAEELKEAQNNPLSDMNRRTIVGFEQVGAASAESTGKPFLDFFINTPLPFGKAGGDEPSWPPPRYSVWGNVRLASTPQQVSAFATAASNTIGAVSGGNLNELVTGFDFSAGVEGRLWKAGRTLISFIAGAGAISPLSCKQSSQVFKVPATTNPQYAAFIAEFPGAKGKDFIAFVPPERDRFLRHYFGGVRFRTYDFEEGQPANRFPAMLDVTFGQSEAVTGGRLHKFVVNLDGFYPLPWPKSPGFLYLFGTAKIKAGGPKLIKTPFILDTAESSVQLTNDKLLITDRASNRDYYRVGFGVDLIGLFKAAKKSGEDEAKKEGN